MTRLSRSRREPEAWSAAVRRNFSVLVGRGRRLGVGSGDEGGLRGEARADWGTDRFALVALVLSTGLVADEEADAEDVEVEMVGCIGTAGGWGA